MTWLALIAGILLGAASASAFWWLWAFRAMHPHDEVRKTDSK